MKFEVEYKEIYINLVANYLKDRIIHDEFLKDKIEKSECTMNDCLIYIREEAKKKAINGCACLEDNEVYELAVHFFLEDIKPKKNIIKKSEDDKNEDEDFEPIGEHTSNKVCSAPKKPIAVQLSLFDGMDF